MPTPDTRSVERALDGDGVDRNGVERHAVKRSVRRGLLQPCQLEGDDNRIGDAAPDARSYRAAAGLRAGTHTLTVRWKFEAF